MKPLYKYDGDTFKGVSGENITVTKAGLLGAFHKQGNLAVVSYFKKFDSEDTFGKKLSSDDLAVELV